MEKVIKAISDYYNLILPKTSNFENALNDCSKEELVEFIMEHQSRGCFSGICYKEE